MKKLFIISSEIKELEKYADGDILTEKDFSPFNSFFQLHPQILAESYDYIFTKGILENSEILKVILKYIAWLLKVDGVLEFNFFATNFDGYGYFVRPVDELAYQISSIFKKKIILIENTKINNNHFRKYKKVSFSLSENDSIDSWSFGIVSDGRKNERILQIIERIESFKIPNYEIIICGPKPTDNYVENLVILDDSSFYDDIRIPLCAKKNTIILNAKYNNLAVFHDRILFSETWYLDMKLYGNYFDCLVPSILNEEDNDYHVIDNAYYLDDVFNKFHFRSKYPVWNDKIYMDGGIFICKTSIARKHLFPDYLHWGEKEDVYFAKNLNLNGFLITFNYDSVVTSLSIKRGLKYNTNNFIFNRLRSYIGWRKLYYKEKFNFYKYLIDE